VTAVSAKEQLVLTAERLFAQYGINGVSLRQISLEAGNGNNSAVSYHFGSRDGLIQAIFENRLIEMSDRRAELFARAMPSHDGDELRTWLTSYLLPIVDQAEQSGNYYLSFLEELRRFDNIARYFDRLPVEYRVMTEQFYDQVERLLLDIPAPIRRDRILQVMQMTVTASADRERAHHLGRPTAPFALHLASLLDGLIGYLRAPISPTTLQALSESAAFAHVPWPSG
jgi:AcrR family transcriptional regulator